MAQNDRNSYDVSLTVLEKGTNEPIIMATCELSPAGIYAATDMNGKAVMKNVPQGEYTVKVSYVGFENLTTKILVNKNLSLTLRMTETSLKLKEVTVTAKQNVSGASTSSIIGRQAIDHLQANSLSDIMQLLPGQSIEQIDMTSRSNNFLQIRQIPGTYNSNNAFGSGLILDGVPMSSNGAMANGQFSSSAYTGADMRQVSADDIESVEVIRGIPSAEYGDLTSGLVVVHSKIGVTPWQLKSKINPNTMNYSLGKGLKLNSAGVLNFNLDYAQAWGDPRKKTNSYHRYTFTAGYGVDITKTWHTDTKFRFMQGREWAGEDPDNKVDGTYWKNTNTMFSLTHNGKISLNKKFSRTINYTLGLSRTYIDNVDSGSVSRGPILTARTTGYYSVPYATTSYLAKGITESRPGSLFAKINNNFFLRHGKAIQRFKMGLEYHYDWNNGKGYYNADEQHPYKQNNSSRPRAFTDIPGMHQFSAYLEDNFRLDVKEHSALKIQAGLRFQTMQPWAEERTFALSPRLNVSYDIGRWLTLRGGIGLNSKSPGLNYLYPDKKYMDVLSGSYTPQDNDLGKIWIYHTEVYDVKLSEGLKNATTTKIELGMDIKLPGKRRLGITAYQDRTPNGFGSVTDYLTYQMNYYTLGYGLTAQEGAATLFDENADPYTQRYMWYTSGMVGNTSKTLNRGIEFDFDLGQIKAINTSFYFSGAYQETKSWSSNAVTANPLSLSSKYTSYNTTPIKFVFPSELDIDSRYRNFINTLRIVTNIPKLRMVASFSGQVKWYYSSYSYIAGKDPVGWITPDLQYHAVSSDMLGGYVGEDGLYYASLENVPDDVEAYPMQHIDEVDNDPTKNPVTWFVSGRLTKEFGSMAGLSFYVNNMFFYEPYLKSSSTKTLSQRNTGNFSFGVELFFNF